MMRAAAAGVALSLSFTGACVLFTGSTDGYTAIDAGRSGGPCSSAASCGDAGVCCLTVMSYATGITGTCMPSCTINFPQLCAMSAECEDAGSCLLHTCMIDGGGGLSFSLQACGQVQDCTASQ